VIFFARQTLLIPEATTLRESEPMGNQINTTENLSSKKGNSLFIENFHYFFLRTDGTCVIPNSSVGDLLKQAYVELCEKERVTPYNIAREENKKGTKE